MVSSVNIFEVIGEIKSVTVLWQDMMKVFASIFIDFKSGFHFLSVYGFLSEINRGKRHVNWLLQCTTLKQPFVCRCARKHSLAHCGVQMACRDVHKITRDISKLRFSNPGRFMEDFDPEQSQREMRKVHRRFYRET